MKPSISSSASPVALLQEEPCRLAHDLTPTHSYVNMTSAFSVSTRGRLRMAVCGSARWQSHWERDKERERDHRGKTPGQQRHGPEQMKACWSSFLMALFKALTREKEKFSRKTALTCYIWHSRLPERAAPPRNFCFYQPFLFLHFFFLFIPLQSGKSPFFPFYFFQTKASKSRRTSGIWWSQVVSSTRLRRTFFFWSCSKKSLTSDIYNPQKKHVMSHHANTAFWQAVIYKKKFLYDSWLANCPEFFSSPFWKNKTNSITGQKKKIWESGHIHMLFWLIFSSGTFYPVRLLLVVGYHS